MNQDLKISVDNLTTEVNRDEMWNKFFNSVEYSTGFLEALEAYKNLDNEIINLVYDVEDMQLGEEFDLFKSIKEDKANLLEEQEKIKQVLDLYGDDLPVVNKEAYEERLSQIPDEIKKVDERSYDAFDKQREEVKIKIEEKKVFLNKWYGYLLSSFGAKGGIKEQMISKAEEYKVNLDKEYDHLKNKLENVKKNLEFAIKQEEEAKKFGETSSQYLEAAKAKHDKLANVISVENEIKEFKNKNLNTSLELVQFIKFLREMTFLEFFERLQNNGYNLKFDISAQKPDGGSSTPDVVEPEPDRDNSGATGTDSGTNPDGEPEPDKDKPEQNGGDNGDGSDGSTTPEDEPKEIDDGKDKDTEGGSGSGDSSAGDDEDKEEEKEEEKKKEKGKEVAKKKIKGIRGIPAIVKEKVSTIVPSLKKFFKTTYENPITRNNNSMSISGLHLQQSLGNPGIGASTLNVITAISDNEYVKKDKNLLGTIRENIRQGLMSKEDRDYDHYFEMYEKIMSLPDDAAKEWFGNVTIKDELMRNIKENCGLSKEQFNTLLEKVGRGKSKEESLENVYEKAVLESQERHKEAMNEVFGDVDKKEQQSYFAKNANAEEEWKKYYEEVEKARLEASEEESHKHGR